MISKNVTDLVYVWEVYPMKIIEVVRKSLGYNQSEVAKAAGINRTFYTEIETGRKIPGEDTRKKLESFFGLDSDLLLNDRNLISMILKGVN
jgi:transcriptional regulator with XRE-family HTH domain